MALAFAMCICAPPLAARGQDEAAARALFAEGRRLAQEGRYGLACTQFEAASKLFASAGVLVNLADCYEKVGRTEDARVTFGEAARVATATNRPEVALEASSRQGRLVPQDPLLNANEPQQRPPPASAAPPAEMSDGERAARALFLEGRQLAADGQFALACQKFESARALYSSAGVLANLADCYEKMGRTASAWRAFGEAVVIATQTGRAGDAAAAQRRQERLELRLSRLTIQTLRAVEGLTVRLDGGDVPRDKWGTAIPVDSGMHEIRAQALGYEPWTASVNASEGHTVTADIPELHASVPSRASEGVATADSAPVVQVVAPGAQAGFPTVREQAQQDEGLGAEWIWMHADVGGAYANLASLNASNLSLQKTATGGTALSMGAGVRLAFLTLGANARDLLLSDFNLWEIDAEAGLHARIDRVDPYFGIRGGYAFVDSVSSDGARATAGTSQSGATGFNVGLLLGIDYYFSHWVSVGVDANPEFLFLKRPPLPPPAGVSPVMLSLTHDQQALYQQSGSSIGFGFAAAARLGVHF